MKRSTRRILRTLVRLLAAAGIASWTRLSEVESIRETMAPHALALIGSWALRQPAG